MKRITACLIILIGLHFSGYSQGLTLEAVKSFPFPTELTAAPQGSKIAWALEEQGKRNVYVAEGPEFKPRKLTNYNQDDGQELTSISISANGQWVVYVRGGDHGSNWGDEQPVNTNFSAMPLKVSVYAVPFAGGDPKTLSEGDAPVISPKSDAVLFIKGGQVWTTPMDGSSPAKNLFTTRGNVHSVRFSPDGSKFAFVTHRDDHSFVGVFVNESTPIQWMSPSYSYDFSPRWSPDGTRLAYIRTPGRGGAPDSLLRPVHEPWTIWVADVKSGKGTQIWKAPATLAGSIPDTHGSTNLHWGAGERIAFLSYHDGWPHLYSISSIGGVPLLLTPGNFMAEHIRMSPDGKWLVFSANTGPDKNDLDRRHAVRVPIDRANVEVMTPGSGLEWTPVVTGDGSTVACISATATRPPVPAVWNFSAKAPLKLIGQIPQSYPDRNLVVPKKVTFKAADGLLVHADLFEPAGGSPTAKKPAIVYIHGGPPRQMLLGWHYSDYYSNAYASNQYLASQGFVVLAVNYRLGIGYGYEFHHPAKAANTGASEYMDIKAAGEWLAAQPQVDPSRIGVYGGSYGGFLTAMALAHDSKLFAAGVDIHGVHDWTTERARGIMERDRYEQAPDFEQALKVAWESSPNSAIATWSSPVLIIHADDDRNVKFNQSTDLVRRLEKKGVPTETMVIVDDTHHWFKFSNAVTVYGAVADYFNRKLQKKLTDNR